VLISTRFIVDVQHQILLRIAPAGVPGFR